MSGLFGTQTSYLTQEDITSLIEKTYTVLGAEIASVRWLDDSTCAVEYIKGPTYKDFDELLDSKLRILDPAERPSDSRAAIEAKKSALRTSVTPVKGSARRGPTPQEVPVVKTAGTARSSQAIPAPKWNTSDKFVVDPSMGPGPVPYIPDMELYLVNARKKLDELAEGEEAGLTLGIVFGNPQDLVGWEQLTCYNYDSEEWREKSNEDRIAMLLGMCTSENPNVRIRRRNKDGDPEIAIGLSAAQTERNIHQLMDPTDLSMKKRSAALSVIGKVHKYKELHGPVSPDSNVSTTLSKRAIAKEMGVSYRPKHKFDVEGKDVV